MAIRGYLPEDVFRRQLLLGFYYPEFQPSLFDKRVLIVGLGGNGTHLALAMVRMGFRSLSVLDHDVVEASNVPRQILYSLDDVGKRKAAAGLECLTRNNLRSQISAHDVDILVERQQFGEFVSGSDVVFAVVDRPGTTFFVASTCLRFSKPMVTGGTAVVYGFLTQAQFQRPQGAPCYGCTLSSRKPPPSWLEFYRWHDEGSYPSYDREASAFDDSIAPPAESPSTFITASTGSNLMIALMFGYLMRREIPDQVRMNLMPPFHFAWDKLNANPECALCAK